VRPGGRGHGPNPRLTGKLQGRTIAKALPTPVAGRKAEGEIAELRKFQEVSHAFVHGSEEIRRLSVVSSLSVPGG
jgi:hypothetical protein